jgi:hypothetical protein
MVLVANNMGYGFYLYNNGTNVKARGVYMTPKSDLTETGDSTANVSDGTVIRIARNSSDVWSVTLDPAGSAEDITPGSGTNFAQDARLWMFGYTSTASTWAASDPPPGIEDVDVSGAGSLGRYDGSLRHDFMWNHVADMGADKNNKVELYVDTT